MMALGGCSGGGGGEAAPDVTPGPSGANGAVPPPAPVAQPPQPNLYAEASDATATITGVTINSPPVVDFQVVDGNGLALTGLTASDVRFYIAKLVPAANGSSSYWQSYLNNNVTPKAVPGNAPAIQATYESGSKGTLVDNGDGTYTYTFATDITNVTSPLAVPYDANLTHRVGIQFTGGPTTNPTYDFVPASGATSGILTRDVVDTASCNSCHDKLALHGGSRVNTKLCVLCHNPGTREPNADVSLDFKVYIHKIHMGRNLPSVVAGGKYLIYGYRDSLHDYSEVNFPMDINNCAKCHAGTETASQNPPVITSTLTSEGDNWQEVPTMEACGSCHDDLDFATHKGGQTDDSNCVSCHSVGGAAGSIASVHENKKLEGTRSIDVAVKSITNTAPGDFPQITFSVTNPLDNTSYDILTDPQWTSGRLAMTVAWSTTDYTNTGYAEPAPSSTNALTKAVSNGDGTYTLTSDFPIADGSTAPNIAATGSGVMFLEGRVNTTAYGRTTFLMDPTYFSIDEADGKAVPRRQVVSIEKCNGCHGYKTQHGDNRTNTEAQCQQCHNPRLATTDNHMSLDFKRMIHKIHAAGIVQTPLVVNSPYGSTTFDANEVQFPGRINDCKMCHVGSTYELPLSTSVLASTYDMGADEADPSDDLRITPTAAVCSSCHDSSSAKDHMVQNGADFAATNSTTSTEACAVCHGPGRVADIAVVHGLQ
jgi:OmcA/MtrC family decaheme c-type cytochrome